MSMQEFEYKEQATQEPSEYQGSYVGSYEMEQQKIQPRGRQGQGSALHIVAIVLSSIGFGFSVVGVVGSALVLVNAHAVQGLLEFRELVAGGVLGLVSSILALLVFAAIFVVALVLLARRMALRRGLGSTSLRRKNMGNRGWL